MRIKKCFLFQSNEITFCYPTFFILSALEIYREFSEEAYSIALHPSGLYLLVGFLDKLRLMNILIDDIKQFKEFTVRGCREVLVLS